MQSLLNLLKRYFLDRKVPNPNHVIGCFDENSVFYCKLDNGGYCGLVCELEHGIYIYSEKTH